MRPRFVINRHIEKKITAIGRIFVPGERYTAVIYNTKYPSTKIHDDNSECIVGVDGRNMVKFDFTSEQTGSLREGVASIEIYDVNKSMMVYRENFAYVRNNSLPIAGLTESES